ncbi:MAG: methionyl-tRNA formyltransferase [Caldisericum exile]|uniref:methionyl-tRNA formyltransferase n=1 Tax=Caldisericum exile TaxID=693075 RepID=UPI003C709B78
MSKQIADFYIVVGNKPWTRNVFNKVISKYKGKWKYIDSEIDLNFNIIRKLNPRYIFFLHWSSKVPVEIIKNFECVCFHMTDVPYGRGGSPLQNLIIRGHKKTKLTALRMTEEFDAGPVYFKEDLSLEGGSAEEVYIRATYICAEMIKRIIDENPKPVPQSGEVVVFKRRKPSESLIPECSIIHSLYDFIRMLDAEGYPKAYIEHAGFRYEFSRAVLYNEKIIADVIITPIKKTDDE